MDTKLSFLHFYEVSYKMIIDIDLDLLDINLPDKDGEDLIEKLTKINLA